MMIYKYSKLIIALMVALIISPLLIISAARNLITGDTYFPARSGEVLNNPYIGWAPSAEGGPYLQPHRLVYINASWRELEPEKGKYDFAALEKRYKFDYWRENSVHIIFRLNMDFPSAEKHMDIPDWLYSEIDGDGTWYDLDYGKGFSPDYTNPLLISYHEKLIEALAARFNREPLIPIIALGSIGHWGEWHTKQDQPAPIPFPDLETSDLYVEHYIRYFAGKQLIMRRPFEVALKNDMGLYNDSFGNTVNTSDYFIEYFQKGYHDYLTDMDMPAMPEFWKHTSSGGEIANPPGMSCFDDNNINTTLAQLKACHTSWLGPSCPAYYSSTPEQQKNYELVLNTLGYRLLLYSVKHPLKLGAGDSLPVKMEWRNNGVAPFYYEWPLELSLSDSDSNIVYLETVAEDIRTWLPGKKKIQASMKLPEDLEPGVYTLCAAIIDPATGRPGLELAIGGRRADGRYSLNQVIITD